MAKNQLLKNAKYNAERKAQDALIKRDLDRDLILERMYRQSYDRMQAQLDNYFMRYAKDTGLALAEVKKRADAMDVQLFADKAKEAVRIKDFSDETNEWLKTYNLKMKVSRLELQQAEIEWELRMLHDEAYQLMDSTRYAEGMAELRRQAGILGESVTNPANRLQGVLDADFYGKDFSEYVWGRTGLYEKHRSEVFKSLSQIYTDMNGYRQERNRLMKLYNTTEYETMRLLKTEVARINSEVQLMTWKEQEFSHFVYVAELGACSICAHYDGMVIPVDEAKMGLNLYPQHPNCRCSSYAVHEMKRKDGTDNLEEYRNYEVYDPDY